MNYFDLHLMGIRYCGDYKVHNPNSIDCKHSKSYIYNHHYEFLPYRYEIYTEVAGDGGR